LEQTASRCGIIQGNLLVKVGMKMFTLEKKESLGKAYSFLQQRRKEREQEGSGIAYLVNCSEEQGKAIQELLQSQGYNIRVYPIPDQP
jgi:hypothetical protein